MSDRAIRYGMIMLDAAPVILRARGTPVFFASPDGTIAYARLHDIMRRIVFGNPDGRRRCARRPGPSTPPRSLNEASTSP